ncbi:hypothetical protein CFIMG_008136RA00001 [Ceratocystis fimbriata CBS 114723]|uniref:Uncharacterized protein n=1 Tax=Ceratocystis fimbriata CBS 114723 TaxID=1035309 RepID=A0A2C5XKP9_9PEZI|nr:hypothetical protein CFIMG_008136RA00001 [Ceratocystis fimbriata CBS 114723]
MAPISAYQEQQPQQQQQQQQLQDQHWPGQDVQCPRGTFHIVFLHIFRSHALIICIIRVWSDLGLHTAFLALGAADHDSKFLPSSRAMFTEPGHPTAAKTNQFAEAG